MPLSLSGAELLIDADAFIAARKLGLLEVLDKPDAPRPALLMTGRIARNELNALTGVVNDLEQEGLLRVEEVKVGSPAAKRARAFRQFVDRGEAEALGWAVEELGNSLPVFISCDAKARVFAKRQGLDTGDVFDLAVAWHMRGLVSASDLESVFAPWEAGRPGELWRPADFTTTVDTLKRRRSVALHARWAPKPDTETSE